MLCVERLKEYEDDDFDHVLLLIKNGTIKSGRYAHTIKINKNIQMNGKEFFNDGKEYNPSER